MTILTATESEQILSEWNDTAADYSSDQCIHELFEIQAARTPDKVAVVFEEQEITYLELNKRANQLAYYLRPLGVGPEVLVGICVDRSVEMIVAILGVLKAGGAYVPVDFAYPAERLAWLLEDSQVPVLLTQEDLVDRLPSSWVQIVLLDSDWHLIAGMQEHNPPPIAMPENAAYVIYTSGSTGKPKGVVVQHRGLCNLIESEIDHFDIVPDSRVLQFVSFSFDVSLSEVFTAFLSGATLCLARREAIVPGPALVDTLRERSITCLAMPSSVLAVVPVEELPALRTIRAGGEICPPSLVARWSDGHRFYNLYGPTEATVCATFTECFDDGCKPTIGRPIRNTKIYLLDAYLHPVPIGVPGDLFIGGDGLARGYLNRPDSTAERFIPSPFSAEPGMQLYKTGDVARFLPDGQIDFLGRIDHQVKIRGFRIELDEIDSALAKYVAVQDCVTIAIDDKPGFKRLITYVVLKPEQETTTNELRDLLKERLPDYMVPSTFVLLDALPLTLNGKVDRRALPAPEAIEAIAKEDFVSPTTPFEELLAGIWAEVLGLERVNIHDNFFELGGHSLLSTQIISRVRDAVQIELPLRSLFESPTVFGLAQVIESLAGHEQSHEAPPLVPVSRDHHLPLSFSQQRLWFIDQLTPGSSAYNISTPIRLKGRLDVQALTRTLTEIIRRHESLRTVFAQVEGEAIQVVKPVPALILQVTELQSRPEPEREAEALNLAIEDGRHPFNLAEGPLLRFTLLRMAEDDHVILVTMHHIISDGWSAKVLVEELMALYEAYSTGEETPLEELKVQYADYAVWQRKWLSGGVLEGQLAYWKEQLKGAQFLELPTDRPRPAIQTHRGVRKSFRLPEMLTRALTARIRLEEVSLFMLLLAAFQVVLRHYTGLDDIVVGTDAANRNRSEIEGLIGFFVNQLALRTNLSNNPSFRELLGRARDTTIAAYAQEDVPFEKVVEALQPQRRSRYSPFFQVKITLQNTAVRSFEVDGITITPVEIHPGTAQLDLIVNMVTAGDEINAAVEYNTDLFDDSTISQLMGHFETVLSTVATNPEISLDELEVRLAEADSQRNLSKRQQIKESRREERNKVRRRVISSFAAEKTNEAYTTEN